MPTVFRYDGFRFFFYSNEGDPREPAHIHVIKGGAEAKFWIEPDVQLARNHGFDGKTLRSLSAIVTQHTAQIKEAWDVHFSR